MDQNSRAQVRLVLEDSVIRAKQAVEKRVRQIYAKNSASGLLKSGATIKGVVGAVDEIAAEFISRCVDDVAAVAKDSEAFAMTQEAVEGFLRFVAGKVDGAAELAAGHDDSDGRIMAAARELYGRSQSDLRRQLEIHRFTFTVPQSSSIPPFATVLQPTPPTVAKNRGGKPLASHWDEMWATMAVMLYVGDLKPATQADIERAMKDWLANSGFEVSDSSVRDRARKLWQKLRGAE